MNLFKNMLFLQGYLIDPREADDGADHYAGYGNHVASEKTFRPLGHAGAAARIRENAPMQGNDICATGACG